MSHDKSAVCRNLQIFPPRFFAKISSNELFHYRVILLINLTKNFCSGGKFPILPHCEKWIFVVSILCFIDEISLRTIKLQNEQCSRKRREWRKEVSLFLRDFEHFYCQHIREIIKTLDNIDHIIQRYAVLETKKLIWGNFQEKVALLTNKTLWGSSYSNLSSGKIPLVLQFECLKKEGNINSKLFSLNTESQ